MDEAYNQQAQGQYKRFALADSDGQLVIMLLGKVKFATDLLVVRFVFMSCAKLIQLMRYRRPDLYYIPKGLHGYVSSI